MVKLVVSDMDGTLLAQNSVLGGRAIRMVQKLKEKGILFTMATGRSQCLSEEYEKLLNLEIPYIACNGAVILKRGEIIKQHQIALKGLRPLVEEADRLDMSVVFSIGGSEFYYKETPWILEKRREEGFYQNPMILTDEIWDRTYLEKLMIMDNCRTGRITLMEDMCRKLPPEYGFTRYTNMSVEIVNCRATKAEGVRFLADYLGIPMDEVMAIGDHKNDCEMLTEAGIGVAVSNAIPDAKECADYVAAGSYLDGVAEAVQMFCRIDTEEAS